MAESVPFIFTRVIKGKFTTIFILSATLSSLFGEDNHTTGNSTVIDCDQPIVYSEDNNSIIARGNARLVNQDVLIQANQVVWNRRTYIAEANGSVAMNYGETRILADSIVVNFRSGEYRAKRVRTILEDWILEANQIEKSTDDLNATQVILHAGEPGSSSLSFKLDSLIYQEGNQSFVARSIIPRVGKLPIGYLPNLKGNFRYGSFFNPSLKLGRSQRLGWYLGYSMGKNKPSYGLDYTGEIIGYEKRGLLLSPSLNYSAPTEHYFSTLTFDGGWIKDQGNTGLDTRSQPVNRNRGFARFRSIYTQKENFRFASQIDWESDSDFLREFQQDKLDQSQWSQGFGGFNYQGKGFLVSAFAKGQINRHQAQMEYLPKISVDIAPINYHGIYHNITGSLARLVEKNEFGQNSQSFDKIDLGYRAMKSFAIQPGISYAPSFSVRNQSYQSKGVNSRKVSGEWANDLTFSFVGNSDYHNESWDIKGLIHYSNITLGHRRLQLLKTENQRSIPRIDEFVREVNLLSIDLLEIEEDRFLRNYDVYRLGWENTLSTYNRQLLRTDFYFDYWKQTNTTPEQMPLFSKLEWSIAPWVSLAIKSNIDTRSGENLMRSTSLSLLDGRFSKATIAYRSFLDWNDFLSFKIETLLTEKLKVSGTAWYDADKSDVTLWSVNLSYFKQSSIGYFFEISERSGTRKADETNLSFGLNLFSF